MTVSLVALRLPHLRPDAGRGARRADAGAADRQAARRRAAHDRHALRSARDAASRRTCATRAAACSRPAARSTTRSPAGRVPVLAAADCSIAVTTLPAALRHRPDAKVLWLDAHGDYNTPETTPARLPGRHVPGGRVRRVGRGAGDTIAPSRVVLAGVRDLDPGERQLLERSEATVIGASAVETLVAVKNALDGAPVYVHLDLDVLDPEAFPAAVPGARRALLGQALRPDGGRGRGLASWSGSRSRRSRRRRTPTSGRRGRDRDARARTVLDRIAADEKVGSSTAYLPGDHRPSSTRHPRSAALAALARRRPPRAARAARKLGGGEEKIARQHEQDKLTARERLALLIDEGTFVELGIHGRPHFSQRAMEARRRRPTA